MLFGEKFQNDFDRSVNLLKVIDEKFEKLIDRLSKKIELSGDKFLEVKEEIEQKDGELHETISELRYAEERLIRTSRNLEIFKFNKLRKEFVDKMSLLGKKRNEEFQTLMENLKTSYKNAEQERLDIIDMENEMFSGRDNETSPHLKLRRLSDSGEDRESKSFALHNFMKASQELEQADDNFEKEIERAIRKVRKSGSEVLRTISNIEQKDSELSESIKKRIVAQNNFAKSSKNLEISGNTEIRDYFTIVKNARENKYSNAIKSLQTAFEETRNESISKVAEKNQVSEDLRHLTPSMKRRASFDSNEPVLKINDDRDNFLSAVRQIKKIDGDFIKIVNKIVETIERGELTEMKELEQKDSDLSVISEERDRAELEYIKAKINLEVSKHFKYSSNSKDDDKKLRNLRKNNFTVAINRINQAFIDQRLLYREENDIRTKDKENDSDWENNLHFPSEEELASTRELFTAKILADLSNKKYG